MTGIIQSILSMPTPFNMIVLVVLMGCVAGLVKVVIKETRKYFCHRQEMEFKRELVERGLNVDEIERVVAAKGPTTGGG